LEQLAPSLVKRSLEQLVPSDLPQLGATCSLFGLSLFRARWLTFSIYRSLEQLAHFLLYRSLKQLAHFLFNNSLEQLAYFLSSRSLEQLAHFQVYIYLCLNIVTDDSDPVGGSLLIKLVLTITFWRTENRFLK
jgi:hypothetical protein